MVSCDAGANITLQAHEVELYNLVKDITSSIDNATNELATNLTSRLQRKLEYYYQDAPYNYVYNY